MATPAPGTPDYYKLPQAQRVADLNAAQFSTGQAAQLEYLTPMELEYIRNASIPDAAWASEIKTKFPDQAQYLAIPEIAGILKQAVDNKWLPGELMSHLQSSNWWLTHSQEQRQWFLLNATDPGAAVKSVSQQTDIVMRQAATLGVRMTAGQAMILATNALQNGWDSPTLTDNIMKGDTQGFSHGTLGATRDQLKGQAEQYLIPMSEKGLEAWTKNIASGRADPAAYKDFLAQQAKSRFADPGLQKALDQGMTVADFADPYVQTAATLLGLNPKDINLADGKWMASLDSYDQASKKRRALTLDEWQTKLRTDNRYGYDFSANGKDQAAQLVAGLRTQFGMG